jgi:hypothetical protein
MPISFISCLILSKLRFLREKLYIIPVVFARCQIFYILGIFRFLVYICTPDSKLIEVVIFMYFQPKLRNFYCSFRLAIQLKVIRNFVDGFLYHPWIFLAHMKLSGNSFMLIPISINVLIRVCLNVKHHLVVKFCENSVFGHFLHTHCIFGAHQNPLHIWGTPEPIAYFGHTRTHCIFWAHQNPLHILGTPEPSTEKICR